MVLGRGYLLLFTNEEASRVGETSLTHTVRELSSWGWDPGLLTPARGLLPQPRVHPARQAAKAGPGMSS